MTADQYLERGATLYDQGNLEEALAALDQSIDLDPWPLETYHYRHGVRLELEARQSLDELEAIEDRHVDVRDDDVELRARDAAQRVHAIIRLDHRQVANTRQRENDQLPHGRAILDDECVEAT